ncbi:MAG TPA: HEAT repeat domain-containing protein [Polyangia bacterium]
MIFSVCIAAGAAPVRAAGDAGAPPRKSRLPAPGAVARKLVPLGEPPRPETTRKKGKAQGRDDNGAGQPEAAPRKGESASSKPGASTRARVAHLLRTSPTAPPNVELAAAGRAVDEALIAIAADDALGLPVRTRAVSALAYTPTRAARTYLMSLVRAQGAAAAVTSAPAKPGKSADAGATAGDAGATAEATASGQPVAGATAESKNAALTLLRRAAVTLGWIGGPLAPPALAPLLDHNDPDVRADAAVGLALTRLPAAATLLRARLARETDGRVRGHLARQLNVIDAALAAPAPAAKAP